MPSFAPPARERGAALLAVLLLVAIVSVIAMAAVERVRLATRLAANNVSAGQAHDYALGAEAFAITRVTELNGRETGGRTPNGGWIGRPFPIPVPGGMVVARLSDGGNCFNLNSVVSGTLATTLTTRPVGVAQFVGLMQALGVAKGEAQRIAEALADWIDGDTIPNPQGAEDDAYARRDPAYRTANTFVGDVSELRVIAGMTPALYALLRPHVCALPVSDLSPIDINTLTPAQAPLVAMLLPERLPVARAAQIIAQRPLGGWADRSAFWTLMSGIGVPDAEVQAQPKLLTRWFRLDLDVTLGDAQVRETALIDGGLLPGRVVARTWGEDE